MNENFAEYKLSPDINIDDNMEGYQDDSKRCTDRTGTYTSQWIGS